MQANEILREAAKTFEEKNAVYGNNHDRCAEMLATAFPDGITLKTAEDHGRYVLFALMMVKLSRYAVQWANGHQDSLRDNTVYSAMLEQWDDDTFRGPANTTGQP